MLEPLTLENDYVKLSPLTLENYHELFPIASQEKLVEYSPSDIETPESLKSYVETALREQQLNQSIPLIIYDKKTKRYAGSTRFMNINRQHRVLEIGSTWIGREYHGSGLNRQMKDLLLNYAFHEMGFEKVAFRIDERNIRSRMAVEKLGGILEGILRKNVYLLDGFKRNTCCYGLLKEEWKHKDHKQLTLNIKQKIANVTIVVKDYDEAIKFYTQKLGFELLQDVQLDADKRWVLVAPPHSTGSALLLAKAVTEWQVKSIGNQTGGRVSFFLHTDDFWRDYKNMTTKGVVFKYKPREEVYGTVTVFEDLYGNLWDLLQSKE